MKTILKISVVVITLALMLIADLPFLPVQLVPEADAIFGVRRRAARRGVIVGYSMGAASASAAAANQAAATSQQQAATAQQQSATAQQQSETAQQQSAAARRAEMTAAQTAHFAFGGSMLHPLFVSTRG